MASTHRRRSSLRKRIQRRRRRRRRIGRELAESTAPLDSARLQHAAANPSLASAADILALQRAYGNRAASGVMQPFDPSATPRAGKLRIQPKLTVGPVGDQHEQEAERVIDSPSLNGPSPLQRDGSFDPGDDFERRLSSQRGGGQPLPGPVRANMEPRLGADLGDVRLHTDIQAAQMSQEIGAQSFWGNFSGLKRDSNSLQNHNLPKGIWVVAKKCSQGSRNQP